MNTINKTDVNRFGAELLGINPEYVAPNCSDAGRLSGFEFNIYDESSSAAYRVGAELGIALNPSHDGAWSGEDMATTFIFYDKSQFQALIKCIEAVYLEQMK